MKLTERIRDSVVDARTAFVLPGTEDLDLAIAAALLVFMAAPMAKRAQLSGEAEKFRGKIKETCPDLVELI